MAVTLEGGFPVTNTSSSTRSSITQSLAVGAGASRLLVVFFAVEVATDSVSSAVFNTSETLTKLGAFGTSGFARAECWYRINPSNVTANVVATLSGTFHCGLAAYVFDGADQTTGLRVASGAQASGTTASHAVTGWASGDYAVDLLSIDGVSHTPVVTGNNVGDFAALDFGAGTNQWRGSHNTTDATMAWSWTTSASGAHIATAVIPADTTTYQELHPDADTAAGSWASTPLWSKIDEDTASPDGTVITDTAV